MSLLHSIIQNRGGPVQSLLAGLIFGSRTKYNRSDYYPEVRGVEISRKEFDQYARPIIFGEVSNRPTDKKDLESRVILNTAINRMKENHGRGNRTTLKDVMTEENQYQAFEGEQYNLYNQGGNMLDVDKRKEINEILDTIYGEMRGGTFEDNTNNAFYYQHKEDGSIEFDDERPLYKA